MKKRYKLWGILGISMLAIVLFFVWQTGGGFINSTGSLGNTDAFEVMENDWTKGNPDADIVIIKYSDFQCPACNIYAAMDNQLAEELGDEVLFVYRHFPLQMHQYAQLAARYAEAAGRQGKFWNMHDALFGNQQQWSSGNGIMIFRRIAELIELDMQQLDQDLSDPEIEQKISLHVEMGQEIGVQGVPAVFINGNQEPFTNSIEEYREQILSYRQ